MSTTPSENDMEKLRHSLAHLLAAAVMEIWPDTKRTIGPTIDNGFYYDFAFTKPISDADLKKIEKRMRKILPTWRGFECQEVTANEAKKLFADNPYKLELIDELVAAGEKITLYTSGTFTDLCRGGHIDNPRDIDPKAFTLTKIAGAYWRGDEKNTMLTRMYGLAFRTANELEKHLTMLKEAEKRDHRKIGAEMQLFTFSELVGSGLPLYTPRGTTMIRAITDYLNELKSAHGYGFVDIPHIGKSDLYKTSGHWDKFQDGIFRVVGHHEEFVLKPMNCPHHTQIYASAPRSWRDLPIRYAEITKQYRDEQAGELLGLSRVRSITIDDTHIFCTPDQVLDEARGAYEIITAFQKTFGFPLTIELSAHDPNNPDAYLGGAAVWKKSEATLKKLLQSLKVDFTVREGEAAFYGPKIDFQARDSLGRTWQLSTIQLDFNLPDRFTLEYTDPKGKKVRPVMIHVAVAGSMERFLSILIEHYAGAFPLWLAPVQVQLIPVGQGHVEYCQKLAGELAEHGIRAEVDDANETVGNKIRKTVKQKVPHLLVIGDKEMKSTKLAVRDRGSDEVRSITTSAFIRDLTDRIAKRA